MSDKDSRKAKFDWKEIDKRVMIPGSVCLLLVVLIGAVFPTRSETALTAAVAWIMDHFKWMYIIFIVGVTIFSLWLVFSKTGDVKLGGKKAKPSFSMLTWITLSLTGTIAVGICFYGVSGPVNTFMNMPKFLEVQGFKSGTPQAVVPTLEYCFLHYGIPSYFLMVFFGLAIAILYYNGKKDLHGSSTLYPLLGEKTKGIIGQLVNIMMIVCLIVCGTNMGLAVIQLNSGIGTVAGMSHTPNFLMALIIFYTVATVIFATSGAHKLMGKLSNINAVCYVIILVFILFATNFNRTFELLFTSVGRFVMDFVPMVTFGDPVYQTGWQNSNSMFYFAWNFVPAMMQCLFYVSISYGRTLRQFIVVNCLVPCIVVFTWYSAFGGNAMFGILNGSNLWVQMQKFGAGISTFAFLGTLPLGNVMKWFFLIVAIMTFITFSDSVAYSFPMLFLKDTEADPSLTKQPKILNVAIAIFMGVLTAVLLFVGGYDALNMVVVVLGFPACVIQIFVLISIVKFLRNREKYDITYQEEMKEKEAARKEEIRAIEREELEKQAASPEG